jgi:predicted membrane-bound spermidine synthase
VRIPLLFLIVFAFGILSMGYQQVASRVLAPYFGGDYIVWSVLISTFLAAFTGGSFLGGWVSGLPERARLRAFVVIGAVAVGSLLVGEIVRKPLLAGLEQSFDAVIPALVIGCVTLFGPPVLTLSSVTPIAIELLSEAGVRSGRAAGRLYGISTVGNIAGVFLTALVLIPNFPMPIILYGWTLTAAACFLAFTLLMTRAWPASH